MKIGVVTTSYPRWRGDSAGAFVEGHVRALVGLGHEVEVIAAGDVDPRIDLRESQRRAYERRDADSGHLVDLRERERRERERREAVDIVRVPCALFYRGGAPDAIERAPLRAMLDAAAFMPRFVATVALRARRWDHVIAHWLAPSALAALPATKPLTAIAHGGDIYTLRRLRLLAPTIAALRARGARLVFVSEQLRAIANADGVVQPMGIDLAHFAALGHAPTNPPTVLFVGRLVPIKGVDVAIEAMLQLPHMQLVIAGDGPERRALEARALANRSRGARITFVGEVDTQRRDQLLRTASVVVVPSRTTTNGRAEGCPTIALEALAAGIPVVATIGRASELVAADDSRALAAAIERAGREHPKPAELVADLAWEAVAQRLLSEQLSKG